MLGRTGKTVTDQSESDRIGLRQTCNCSGKRAEDKGGKNI